MSRQHLPFLTLTLTLLACTQEPFGPAAAPDATAAPAGPDAAPAPTGPDAAPAPTGPDAAPAPDDPCAACLEGEVCADEVCVPAGMSVAGNQLRRDGAPFYPRGFNMIGLLSPDGCASPPGMGVRARAAFGETELRAARDAWGANTLRFQVSQRGLDPQDSMYRDSYVERVQAGVALARSLGFVVILSMQDQSISCGSAHPLPSSATKRSWATLAPLFRDDRHVMFELFNEPQSQETAAGWAQWREGGATPLDNQGADVVGHQELVHHLRALGAPNVLIADGANKAGKLQSLPLLDDDLAPAQILYAVHPYYFHIADNSTLAQDRANWDTRFGYLTATVPVIATEWNAGACDCQVGGDARVPDLLAYLHDHRIGLLGHAFDVSGTMVKDLTSWAPTSLAGWGCDTVGIDAGELVQAFFLGLAAAEAQPAPPPPPPGTVYHHYFGNTHSHSVYSDGDGTPAEHFAIARQAGYDFYAVTDHALAKYAGYTVAHYQDTLAAADAATSATFVGIAGFEFSENSDPAGTGHVNVLAAAATLDASAAGIDLPYLYDWLAALTGPTVVASFNHPSASSYAGFAYLTPPRRQAMAMCEVVRGGVGGHYDAYLRALDLGWKVGAISAIDNHGTWGITNNHPERTAVLAPSLTRANVLEAMRLRRVYGTWDSNLRVTFEVNGRLLGSTLVAPTELAFAVTVEDPDTGDAGDEITLVEIVTGGGAVAASRAFGAHSVTWTPVLGATPGYYFLRVYARDRTDATAYTAPVWVE